MKYLQISTVASYGSIGRIMCQNYNEKKAQGWDCYIAYGRGDNIEGYQTIHIGTIIDSCIHGLETRLFDKHGLGSVMATKRFIKWIKEYDADIIHLHNLHGYYLNYEILFKYLKNCGKTIKWTLHDCWSFTGHCSYFTTKNCEQWKKHCLHCPQLDQYPKCFGIGNISNNFEKKKAAFTNVPNMTLIVPSHWLEKRVQQSFLKEYPIEVIYNTVDTKVFRPTPSDFRERYNLQKKKIVLGVASVWENRKGIDDFLRLADMLDDSYTIVLVGLTKKQIRKMPKKIKGIVRTNNPSELAAIYSAADVFVNLSKEETFGMTTVEAKLCGTEAIVYKDTACEEAVSLYGGITISQGNLKKIVASIVKIVY